MTFLFAFLKGIKKGLERNNAQKEAISQITKIIKEENISCNLEQVESFVIAHNKKEAKKVEAFFQDFKTGEYTKYSATASIV